MFATPNITTLRWIMLLTGLAVLSGVSGSACAAVAVDHVRTRTAVLTRVGIAFVDFYKHI